MTESVPCRSCGSQVDGSAKFCPNCGAIQDPGSSEAPTESVIGPGAAEEPVASELPTSVEPSAHEAETHVQPAAPPPSGSQRFERAAPGAGDLARQIGRQVSTPGFALAGIAALITTGVMFALGLIMAIALPENSLLSLGLAEGGDTVKEAFRQTASFTLAGFSFDEVDYALRVTPALFGVIMLLTTAVTVGALCSRLPRTAELAVRERLVWGAATGAPLGIVFLLIGLISKETDDGGTTVEIAAGSVFLLASMWGALGGTLGALWSLRREARLGELRGPAWLGDAGRTLAGVTKPLGILLALCALIGTAVWVVQTFRDAGEIKSPNALTQEQNARSTLTATIDHVLYAADHSVHYAELGAAAEFHTPVAGALGLPVPVTKVDEVVAEPNLSEIDATESLTPPGSFRIFDYSGAVSVWIFIPSLALILATALLALYAGFAAARSRFAASPGLGAAWGALVGPIWGVAMVLLNALVQKDYMGKADGDSVFVMFLLGGAVLGAVGGLLAAQSQPGDPHAPVGPLGPREHPAQPAASAVPPSGTPPAA